MPITVGGKVFHGPLWMIAQAQEFMLIQRMIASEVEMAVYGDGLISHIIKTYATEDA
jgi:hypothetical protein